ncbi:hypothetical protein FH972_025842 [Carpinus fangiana]|uniref:UDENN domain-containing protein n=1 Tax=Carpinus fangiana TaxID=176857 RepID=A0A5N6L4S1_9ROSI|nr:hypothetical protein FH972_025842 [Carpinus fangiana]
MHPPMAPLTSSHDASSAPLADYFYIAGIESSRVFPGRSERYSNGNGFASSPPLDPTVEETDPTPTDLGSNQRPTSSQSQLPASPSGNKRASARFSWDTRKSIGSVIGLEGRVSGSNRSSRTIRQLPSAEDTNGTRGNDPDFEEVLRRFAADRDSVLEEIQFSAGQLAQPARPAPRPRPKAHRIVSGDQLDKGSIRRRLSTMNPLSRSNTTSRRSSVRASRRISDYNAVIPAPQRFSRNENIHPLKRPYEPALLDQYPTRDMTDESKRRLPFPDFVPMFVFPNDIHVVSSDVRPKTTWHGFALTGSDGAKLYSICLITWVPLAEDAADELEYQCEEWRKRNMSDEERELANSLGERLAAERTRLSQLLQELRDATFDSAEQYEEKQEQISATEEKIQLMTDMLRPVRHGAASKIEGLTDGESGLWIPRAYGVMGRDVGMTAFWKEWLRAIVVPMSGGSVLGVPPSSPKVGIWEPLERYVVNLCAEALSPTTSITQVELAVRELRLYARKEAINEIPGSRNTDLYPLFRSLQIPDIIVLLEYVLADSRIILLSSHTSMLHLATQAILQLIYPFKWSGVLIPVLPIRLIQALEAPCPYIVGIERRYENVELPEDDFVLVDLDQGIIESTQPPVNLPRQQRRKLNSLLQLAAPHHYRYGVETGPPLYATDAYPHNKFCSENQSVFDPSASASNLHYLANLASSSFGSEASQSSGKRAPVFNAFLQARTDSKDEGNRPITASTVRTKSPPSPSMTSSPSQMSFTPGPLGRNDSAYVLQASLREKRSGAFDVKRQSSFGLDKIRRPSATSGHGSNLSVSTLSTDTNTYSNYAPSVYAQSTLAASTIMPQMLTRPVQSTETTKWVEGHCLRWMARDSQTPCSLCNETGEEGILRCSGCGVTSHHRCTEQICLVCPEAFHPDQIRAAFVRCFASLLYTYRKFMSPAIAEQRRTGDLFKFNMDAFIKSVPHDHGDYLSMLKETQGLNDFIGERLQKPASDPSIRLFDEVILSKRARGRPSIFSRGKQQADFLSSRSDHLWRTAAATTPSSRQRAASGAIQALGRAPAQLDPTLLKEPRVMQGVPRAAPGGARRKPVPSMLVQSGLRLETGS